MALVKCPECGRENIPDSEENCPNCCYGIKAYYDLIKHEEEKQEQAKQEQIRQEKAKQEVLKRSQIDIAEWKYREECIKSVPRLKRPKLVAPILMLLISPLCFLFGKLELESPVKGIPRGIPQTDYYDPVVAGVLYIVIGIGFICYAIYLFYKRMKRY